MLMRRIGRCAASCGVVCVELQMLKEEQELSKKLTHREKLYGKNQVLTFSKITSFRTLPKIRWYTRGPSVPSDSRSENLKTLFDYLKLMMINF